MNDYGVKILHVLYSSSSLSVYSPAFHSLSGQGRSQHFRYRGAKGITRAKRAPKILNASTLNTSWADHDLKKGGAIAPFAPLAMPMLLRDA